MVSQADKLRTFTVLDLVTRAKALQETLRLFKAAAFGDVDAFCKLLAEQYDIKLGGKQGNTTLTTYDGLHKVTLQVSHNTRFGPEIKAAEALIAECLAEWTAESRDEVKVLVQDAFRADSAGELVTSRILPLLRHHIVDDRWQRAMKAIRDSMFSDSTTSYIRLYERENSDQPWRAIPLDLAKL